MVLGNGFQRSFLLLIARIASGLQQAETAGALATRAFP